MSTPDHDFRQRCLQASKLVDDFLADSLPWGPISPKAQGYIHKPLRRNLVKEKVKKSLEVLDDALARQRYVYSRSARSASQTRQDLDTTQTQIMS